MKILAELNTIGTEKSGKGVVKFFIHFFDPVFQGMGDWKPVDFPGHVVGVWFLDQRTYHPGYGDAYAFWWIVFVATAFWSMDKISKMKL